MTTSRTRSLASTLFLSVCVGYMVLGLLFLGVVVTASRSNGSAEDRQTQKAEVMKASAANARMAEGHAFIKEVRADNLTAAYRMTSPSYQKRVGQKDFEHLIRKHPNLKHPDRCFVDVNVVNLKWGGRGGSGSPFTGEMSAPTHVRITVGEHGGIDEISIFTFAL